ncbi:FkbM family methyltransferase [Mucilaginibacter sp. ZT4R22]|uniref:FkbM family methyltransferase n=1 Tax=Mucilaginibacter pankratovii TaxID=2772110 RepID=A0ABR7WR23_9SPHI|nr:FkbM family methyltransferase [Mucilaginibacter pankratovii]MBD1363967.1 FkbM family methyltransferase [Mucilaginibacter pankratovii]
MKPLLFINKLYNKLSKTNIKLSFSQSGEDSIILFLIRSLKITQVQYFDIGTNDPRNMNNTYILYLNGFRGICVEPDPFFHKQIKKYRPGDVLIPKGVAVEQQDKATFYVMDDPLLNTFSPQEAEKLVNTHHREIRKVLSVELIAINTIFEQYFKEDHCSVLSLDVEGLDLVILQSIDFSRFKPSIICVENIEYSENLTGKKDSFINEVLLEQGYILYADTYINSIFIDSNFLKK